MQFMNFYVQLSRIYGGNPAKKLAEVSFELEMVLLLCDDIRKVKFHRDWMK